MRIELMLGIMLLIFAIVVLIFVFWIQMMIDCLKRNFKSDGEKIAWTIVIVFLGILGAAVYYFVVKKAEDKKKK